MVAFGQSNEHRPPDYVLYTFYFIIYSRMNVGIVIIHAKWAVCTIKCNIFFLNFVVNTMRYHFPFHLSLLFHIYHICTMCTFICTEIPFPQSNWVISFVQVDMGDSKQQNIQISQRKKNLRQVLKKQRRHKKQKTVLWNRVNSIRWHRKTWQKKTKKSLFDDGGHPIFMS